MPSDYLALRKKKCSNKIFKINNKCTGRSKEKNSNPPKDLTRTDINRTKNDRSIRNYST